MKERPIQFTTESVQAILEGRKTQTRRVMRKQPHCSWTLATVLLDGTAIFDEPYGYDVHKFPCPYGRLGDRLWVREAWNARFLDYKFYHQYLPGDREDTLPGDWGVFYQADDLGTNARWDAFFHETVAVPKWLTFTPRWASRLTLELTGVRVERVQDISEEDAIAEGIQMFDYGPDSYNPSVRQVAYGLEKLALGAMDFKASCAFRRLWDSINAKRGYSWVSNPWVWVLEFRKV